MAIDLTCYVAQDQQDAREIVSRLRVAHVDLLTKYFVLYNPREVSIVGKEIALEFGFNAESQFLLSLNVKKEVVRMKEAENILKTAFGDNNILILNDEVRH